MSFGGALGGLFYLEVTLTALPCIQLRMRLHPYVYGKASEEQHNFLKIRWEFGGGAALRQSLKDGETFSTEFVAEQDMLHCMARMPSSFEFHVGSTDGG